MSGPAGLLFPLSKNKMAHLFFFLSFILSPNFLSLLPCCETRAFSPLHTTSARPSLSSFSSFKIHLLANYMLFENVDLWILRLLNYERFGRGVDVAAGKVSRRIYHDFSDL